MPHPEAVFILNAGPNHDTRRIEEGLKLSIDREIGRVVMVGTQAEMMWQWGTEHRLADSAPPIYTEDRSRDTIGNAHFSKTDFIMPNEWEDVVICSGDYQQPRAEYLYGRVLGKHTNFTVHGVETRYSAQDKRELRRKERFLLYLGKAILAGVGAEDDTKRERRIYTWDPAYSESRTFWMKSGLKKILGGRPPAAS